MRHRGSGPRVRPLGTRGWPVAALGLWAAIGFPASSAHAKVEAWRQEGPAAFAKSHRQSVVISDNGRVRLGHAVAPLAPLGAARVWDLARGHDGVLLAATGDSGQVFRREPRPNAAWT